MTGIVCSIPIISGFLAICAAPPPIATGYVEGQFLMMASLSIAQVEDVPVRRGQLVGAGEVLARMERRDAEIALAKSEAALVRAQNELADLRQPKRDEEIRVIEAEIDSARSRAREAEKAAQRMSNLFDRGVISQSQLDDAETRLDVARALMAEMQANLAVAQLPARERLIAAAEAAVDVARASRDEAAWQLEKRELISPASGMVFEIFRREGEISGPDIPVLSFLPDGAVLLRLYAPESYISSIHPGVVLDVNCDGCPGDATATVTYVSDSPEFTPPVIYSPENRQKLVYLIEARPDPGIAALKPGQIVDVHLGQSR